MAQTIFDQDFQPDFELPALSFDAVMDREEGRHPPGVRQELLDDMFVGFATRTVEIFTRLMRGLGAH